MNNSITFDLFEDKLEGIKTLIKTAPNAFIKNDLRSFYRTFQRQGGSVTALEQELHHLLQSQKTLTLNAYALVDEWTSILFLENDTGTWKRCRELLHLVYTEFDNSEAFIWISERFKLNKASLLQTADSSTIFDWLVLWSTHHYPSIALFLLGNDVIKRYLPFKDLSLKNLISYLPEFILWGIKTCSDTPQQRYWMKELAKGKNIRDIKGFPIAFTKKMAHHFSTAPKEMDFNTAIWYGIVLGLQGNRLLLKGFQQHFGHWDKDLKLLKRLIDFFKLPKHQVDAEELSQLLGYLQHLWDENGDLSLKGWTLSSLRHRSDQWYLEILTRHSLLQMTNAINTPQSWVGAPYQAFKLELENEVYHILQLTSAKELFEEGRKMKHCVGSYISKCLKGRASIWSLRQITPIEHKRLVTIEVSKHHHIVQARKKRNAIPNKFHWDLIRRWAARENLECRAYR